MVITFEDQPDEVLAPGVRRSRLAPGGKDGPDGIVRDLDQPGGVTWSESWSLGTPTDPWRVTIPDIRMARNQFWPLHWHDCWTAVVILDGSVMVGDWRMQRGDVLFAAPSVEYGPLLNGPKGCQLLEIFARDVLAPGGYALEYQDHPTLVYLQGVENIAFQPRPRGSEHNAGRQCVSCDGTPGLFKAHLDGNGSWDLGDPQDPQRGVLMDEALDAGSTRPAARYGDWRAMIVLDGAVRVGDVELGADDLVVVEPGAEVPELTAGESGVHLLEVARTAAACVAEEASP